ncbi:MAG TPA: STAS domain-containing protein [Acidimicrobiales bacterium]|nr:STAS domain-containing protein [Acidimicrobiales bacterium]
MTDSQDPMTVSTDRVGDTIVIALTGELDLHSSELLATTVADALATGPGAVDIDGERLSFADSAGLRALLSAREAAEENDVRLRLVNVSAPLGRLLDMTGLRDVFGAATG